MMEVTVELRQVHNTLLLLVVRGAYIDSRGIAVRTGSTAKATSSLVTSGASAAVADSHQLKSQTSNSSLRVSDTSGILAEGRTRNSIGKDKDKDHSADRDNNADSSSSMAETSQPAGGPGGPGGARPDHVSPADLQTYQQERANLKLALNKRANLRKKLAELETSIANHETEYLEGTPTGNIITGFDNYTKGTTSAAAQRRRTGLIDQNRVFSRSSISYNALNPESSEAASSTSTPGAPTPLSTTFANTKDSGSNQPTPTSATEKKGPGGKKKKARASAAGPEEESETDTPRETKKVRTNFGARK